MVTVLPRGAPGVYVPKGSSSESLPSSASCRMSAATNVLVTLAMEKTVSGSILRSGVNSA